MWKYNFDFLDNIFEFDIDSYYEIILSTRERREREREKRERERERDYKREKNLYNYLLFKIIKNKS